LSEKDISLQKKGRKTSGADQRLEITEVRKWASYVQRCTRFGNDTDTIVQNEETTDNREKTVASISIHLTSKLKGREVKDTKISFIFCFDIL
jgi:hypothetical protein